MGRARAALAGLGRGRGNVGVLPPSSESFSFPSPIIISIFYANICESFMIFNWWVSAHGVIARASVMGEM